MGSPKENVVGLALNIGAVSRATGIPANTLRTWERRYGFPAPTRTEGGQRVYDPGVVPRLNLVAKALAQGHRPRHVLTASVEELRSLLGVHDLVPDGVVDQWIHAARSLDGESLETSFRKTLNTNGGPQFIEGFVAPFLEALGENWARGDIGVYHEHFATERLRGFLFNVWRDLADRNGGALAVAATLPGESHDLGLHLAAASLTFGGARVLFLGAESPVDDIVECARQTNAKAVVVSISSYFEPGAARSLLRELRLQLPDTIQLIAGGGGCPADVDGVDTPDNLTDLTNWASR